MHVGGDDKMSQRLNGYLQLETVSKRLILKYSVNAQ